jgi:hydrogenase-4 component B
MLFPRSKAWGQWIALLLTLGSTAVGLTGCVLALQAGKVQTSVFFWPAAGNSVVGADALSVFFLVPIFLMGLLGSIYGLGYWPQIEHRRNGRKVRLFWGLMVAGMALVTIAQHAMAFLLGWEVMAIAAYFLISAEDDKAQCRKAGLIYLIATHLGTLSLFAMFALWRCATGSFSLQPAEANELGVGTMNAIFLLSLIGFGVKAGIMPLHFWLPSAHANAPSHVSAILSGVVIKMGIYGLLRILMLLPNPPAIWGGTILVLGAVDGVLGVAFAIAQHDLKRLLAYHSIENIGIILMGLGLAMLGRSFEQPEWVVLGLAGCLLHVWNHGLFKSLLFLCAGSVIHAAKTREIDRLGGLAKKMPWTSAMFMIGAVAICGLPPLNGFISELFIYLGLFRGLTENGPWASATVLAAPALALIGALAVACFVKVFGIAFLGEARTKEAAHAHETPFSMRGPMIVLAACCVLIGLAPFLASPLLDSVIGTWMPEVKSLDLHLATFVPLKTIGIVSISLVASIAVLAILSAVCFKVTNRVGTWDCGYARPTPKMQYTASSFAQMIVSLFGFVLRPREHRPAVNSLFPAPSKMESHVDDAVFDRLLEPIGDRARRFVDWVRTFQRGMTQHYVLCILITVILMLGTLIPFGEYLERLFLR